MEGISILWHFLGRVVLLFALLAPYAAFANANTNDHDEENRRESEAEIALSAAIRLAQEIVLDSEQQSIGESLSHSRTDIVVNADHSFISDVFYSASKYSVIRLVQKIINKLSYRGDPAHYRLKLTANLFPWMSLHESYLHGNVFKAITGHYLFPSFSNLDERRDFLLNKLKLEQRKAIIEKIKITESILPQLELNMGIFAFVHSEDELAALIAYQLSIFNPGAQNFKGNEKNSKWIEDMLRQMDYLNKSEGQLQAQIHADLAAVDRLIKAGYNPWAIYNIQKRLSDWARVSTNKSLFSKVQNKVFGKKLIELSAQPLPDLRMGIIKKFISFRQFSQDLSDLDESKKKLPNSLFLLKLRANALAQPFLYGRSMKMASALAVAVAGLSIPYFLVLASPSNFNKMNEWLQIMNEQWQSLVTISKPYLQNGSAILGVAVGAYLSSIFALHVYRNIHRIKLAMIAGYESTKTRFANLAKRIASTTLKILLFPVSVFKKIYRLMLWSGKVVKEIPQAGEFVGGKLLKWIDKSSTWIKERISKISIFLDDYKKRGFKAVTSLKEKYFLSRQLREFENSNAEDYLADISYLFRFSLGTFGHIHELSLLEKIFYALDRKNMRLGFRKLRLLLTKSSSEDREFILGAIVPIFHKYHDAFVFNKEARQNLISIFEDFGGKLSPDNIVFESFSDTLKSNLFSHLFHRDDKKHTYPYFLKDKALVWARDSARQNFYNFRRFISGIYIAENFSSSEVWVKFAFLNFLFNRFDSYSFTKNKHLTSFIRKNFFSQREVVEFFEYAVKPVQKGSKDLKSLIHSRIKEVQEAISPLRECLMDLEEYIMGRSIQTEPSLPPGYDSFDNVKGDLKHLEFLKKGLEAELAELDIRNVLGLYEEFYGYLKAKRNEKVRITDTGKHISEGFYPHSVTILTQLNVHGTNPAWDKAFVETMNSITDQYAKVKWLTFSRNINFSNFEYKSSSKSIRSKWDSEISKWFFEHLSAKASTIRELAAFIEREFLENVDLEGLTQELYKYIFDHPELIKTKEDIEALTKAEFFWPKRGSLHKAPSKAERIILKSIEASAEKYPQFWQVEPTAAEGLHRHIVNFSVRNKIYNESWQEQFELWKLLSSRGVTSVTDSLFENLLARSNEIQKQILEQEGLTGRIWDQPLKSALLKNQVKQSRHLKYLLDTRELKVTQDLERNRLSALKSLIGYVQEKLPERGLGYLRILEDISTEIYSYPEEAEVIHRAKYGDDSISERVQDSAVKTLSEVLDTILNWSKTEQWEFILFLKGDIEPNAFILSQFASVGPERVRRMFQLLPLDARAGLLETFLSSTRGLLPKVDPRNGYSRTIIDHILKGNSVEAQNIGRQILEAFMYSMKGGNENLRSYVISYLLAMLKSNEEASVGRVLKNIFEVFGTTGVKIGQILAATEILDPKDTDELYSLQERARIPDRAAIYKELRELTGKKVLPFRLLSLKGAASLKYAVHIKYEDTGEELVFKVLRLEAQTHTNSEFKQLERMARYLVQHYGSKYGLLNAIIKAARKAVEREQNIDREVEMSKIAARRIYYQKVVNGLSINVPHEIPVAKRLMGSQLAPGLSVKELEPNAREYVSQTIWKIEGDNLYRADKGDDIYMDPDRHPGNYRVNLHEGQNENQKIRGDLAPIDFGQVVKLTEKEREQIFSLFSVAQISKRSGPLRWTAQKIIKILDLPKNTEGLLLENLHRYFDSGRSQMTEVAAYYNLLAALEDSGQGRDIVFFDFVRGNIQLGQYRKFISNSDSALDPKERLKAHVQERVERMKEELKVEVVKSDGFKGRVIQGLLDSKASPVSRILAKCAQKLELLSSMNKKGDQS